MSQIPTSTYRLAKRLCNILAPYTPTTYCLQSATDFLDILNNNTAEGVIASLDVESLLTNVPVNLTIDYIMNRVYRNDTTPHIDIPEDILRELLKCCTQEIPFVCPRRNKYRKIDGVAMGSSLGVFMAYFFIGGIEKEVIKKDKLKPKIYCRYIDDIFIKTDSKEETEKLRNRNIHTPNTGVTSATEEGSRGPKSRSSTK